MLHSLKARSQVNTECTALPIDLSRIDFLESSGFQLRRMRLLAGGAGRLPDDSSSYMADPRRLALAVGAAMDLKGETTRTVRLQNQLHRRRLVLRQDECLLEGDIQQHHVPGFQHDCPRGDRHLEVSRSGQDSLVKDAMISEKCRRATTDTGLEADLVRCRQIQAISQQRMNALLCPTADPCCPQSTFVGVHPATLPLERVSWQRDPVAYIVAVQAGPVDLRAVH